jgi:uncharacterized membrane protein
MGYLFLKAVHVLAVAVFLGNIITGVFWKRHADRLATLAARAQAIDGLIGSDRRFTTPGVFVIIITGVWMALVAHLPLLGTKWIAWSLALFAVSGVAFMAFIVPLQRKLLANVRAGIEGDWDEAGYLRLSRRWDLWGAIATLAPLGALLLMVLKPV